MEKISVIIPTYKNRGGLAFSINSVLNQDYAGYMEIIIVDDNNADSEFRRQTEDLLMSYSADDRIIYVKHDKNKNGAAARNTGIRHATGDYIAFLDDDDIFLPGKLSKQVEYLDNHQDKDAVYCFANKRNKILSNKILEDNGTRYILMLQSNYYTPTLMFRKQVLCGINGFDESFRRHQDYELLLRFFANGYKIGCVPETLVSIGENSGENIPIGDDLNNLKAYFFEKFSTYIQNEDQKSKGFANKVYARHYAGVLLSHIKHHYYVYALKTLKYFVRAPYSFVSVIMNSLTTHIQELRRCK